MKETLKRLFPRSVWQTLRNFWYWTVDLIESVGPRYQHVKYCGFTLIFNRGNALVGRLKKESIFEEKLCSAVVEQLKTVERPTFLDIGANIGLVSLYVASKIKNVKIHAFEPGPVQRSLLQMTIANNALGKIINLHAYALGKETGSLTFHTHDSKRVAHDGFADTGRAGATQSINVEVITADTWWQEAGKPLIQAVKIDVEGAELWVLEGARAFISACRPTIYLEIEPRNIKAYPYTPLDILSFFDAMAYDLTDLEGSEVSAQNMSALLKQTDTFVASPRI